MLDSYAAEGVRRRRKVFLSAAGIRASMRRVLAMSGLSSVAPQLHFACEPERSTASDRIGLFPFTAEDGATALHGTERP